MATQEEITQSINSRLTMPANRLEGGFSQDIIESVAYELANIINTRVEPMLDNAFVSTASGEYLDLVGADYGMPRREDTAATVFLKITGTPGATVNNLVKATFNDLVFTVTEYKIIPQSGEVLVKAKCETSGKIGNVPADTITEFATVYQGLISVTNPEPAFDGFDREDDETYRQRILQYLAEDATNANKNQYKKWASEVTGVQKVVVKGADEGAGPGNVDVYIAATDTEVSQELINAVKTQKIKFLQLF